MVDILILLFNDIIYFSLNAKIIKKYDYLKIPGLNFI